MNKIARQLLLKRASADIGSAVYLLATAAAIGTLAASSGAGYATAKLTQPGAYDNQNLQKQYMLQRIKRDNKVQQAELERQAVQRAMRNKAVKPMRVF